MNEDNICSVCWDTFKFPKLLPCKHTFCLSCLHEFLEGLQDKSNLVCPLCREPCYVPEKGFSDFPTNYFVPVEKIAKHCQECNKSFVSKVCFTCNTFLCMKCDVAHSHTKSIAEGEEEDSDSGSDVGLPFHVRWQVMHANMKSEFLYKQISMFVAEFPSTGDRRKNIRSLAFSRNGGVYVILRANPFLLKYNKNGIVIDRIRLASQSASVLETSSDLLLITLCNRHTTVLHIPGFEFMHFAKTPNFYPLGIAELQNRNIVIGGPTHLCSNECKDDDCELAKNSPGLLNVFSPIGEFLYEISVDASENIFRFPTRIAASSKVETIAVCDTILRKVIVLDYKGKVQALYKGWNILRVALSREMEAFRPISVCSTSDGNYVIADLRQDCLHVLSPSGKFIGILRCENSDILSHTSAVCIDSEDNIWVGHYNQGTVSVLKPSRFRNVFDQLQLSLLSELPLLSDDGDEHFLSYILPDG